MSCPLCQKAIENVDFTDTNFLQQFVDDSGRINSRYRTHLCAQHQRKITRAIKKARYLGLLPYVVE
jgi:small subunit ribosomal protein S18